ncbi:potassium channel family protein [Microbacterium hominis]|uniref:TrkA family potassium uptake protein n=1 Tax=Microbacterium hominis TaxID=162426 RepID=A0A7D4TFC8_9MICO|nr:TrkA family potassium uptake protein [Microbacterium hominis]QKJ18501.1 TrkA family potassium uptake protein [Microbacterium hominis]
MAKFSLFSDTSRRIAEADSVAVIGLGRFGTALAEELMASGTEVLGIDTDEDLVQSFNGVLTQAVRADATKEEVLRQLAVDQFDRVVVAIGHDLQASILTASLLLQLKVPVIWAKAVNEQHGRILEQLGVHHVIYPEREMGRRVAHLVRGAAMDYLEIERGYSLAKIVIPATFTERALGETSIRQKHGITVTAYHPVDGVWQNADNATVLHTGDKVLIVGPTERVEAFAQLR